MKWALFLLVILLTVVSVAQITPEEKLIRETYAKIELATQINYVQQALTDVNSKLPLPELLKQNRLEFRLSDFHVGDLADVLKEPYGTFITRPVGQDNLQITKGIFNAQRGQNAYRNVYATVEWVHNRMVAPVEWDTMLVGHVLDATQMSENSTYSRYASYTISVTFQGKTQTRRATWFYGKDKEGEAIVLTGDHLTGSAAVNAFVHQPIYPAALLEDPSTRSKPAVEEWLRTVAQDCPGNRRDNCYDETTGKAGISRQDIYKQTSSFKRYQTGQSCKGGDTCDLYSFVTSATRVVPRAASEEHLLGWHLFTPMNYGACNYSGNSGTCLTRCSATPNGHYDEVNATLINPLFVHVIRTASASGTASGYGAASCGSVYGGSVKSCLLASCSVRVSANASANGIGGTISYDPEAIHNDQHNDTLNCAAKSISSTSQTPGGCSSIEAQQCNNRTGGKCFVDGSLSQCYGSWDDSTCTCEMLPISPLIIHLGTDDGRRIQMTSAELGVLFAVRPGHPEQVSWTAPNAEDAFLALDLNRNGTIDDGSELFGNFTPQPPPSDNQERNGFLALAEYDALEQGGNSNGYIDEKDAIFNQLSLWFDTNHDGISDLGELHGLAEFSVRSINLNYHESRYTDEYGNEFRYRAKVERKESQANTSFMYDVFLTAQ